MIITLMIAALIFTTSAHAQDSMLVQGWSKFKNSLAEKLSKDEPVYKVVSYNDNESNLEAWMSDLKSWASSRINHRTSSLDEDLVVEEWMSTPFISRSISCTSVEILNEEDLAIESWMSEPFNSIQEEDLEIEPWMTRTWTMESDEDSGLESWMSTPEKW